MMLMVLLLILAVPIVIFLVGMLIDHLTKDFTEEDWDEVRKMKEERENWYNDL